MLKQKFLCSKTNKHRFQIRMCVFYFKEECENEGLTSSFMEAGNEPMENHIVPLGPSIPLNYIIFLKRGHN